MAGTDTVKAQVRLYLDTMRGTRSGNGVAAWRVARYP